MLLCSSTIFQSTQYRQFQALDRLPLKLCLELGIDDIKVDIIGSQLMLDIERSIVSTVILIGIKSTRGVQGIRVRVDIEVTLHLTRHDIHILTQCTRSLLLTIRSTTNHVHRQIIENMMCDVGIESITIYLAIHIPSWIKHGTHGSIIIRLACTTTQADRVVLHNIGREEFAKPIGIAELSLLQVSVLCLLSILDTKHTTGLIVSCNQFIHLTIDAIVATIQNGRKIQPTFLLHLLIDSHLVLRVQNIEIAIRRNQTSSKLTRIVDMSLTLLTFFGGNNDDTSHRTSTINRSSGTILQNLEAFNIIRVQACDS